MKIEKQKEIKIINSETPLCLFTENNRGKFSLMGIVPLDEKSIEQYLIEKDLLEIVHKHDETVSSLVSKLLDNRNNKDYLGTECFYLQANFTIEINALKPIEIIGYGYGENNGVFDVLYDAMGNGQYFPELFVKIGMYIQRKDIYLKENNKNEYSNYLKFRLLHQLLYAVNPDNSNVGIFLNPFLFYVLNKKEQKKLLQDCQEIDYM